MSDREPREAGMPKGRLMPGDDRLKPPELPGGRTAPPNRVF